MAKRSAASWCSRSVVSPEDTEDELSLASLRDAVRAAGVVSGYLGYGVAIGAFFSGLWAVVLPALGAGLLGSVLCAVADA